MEDEVVTRIAHQHGKTPAQVFEKAKHVDIPHEGAPRNIVVLQVLLRHLIQLGHIVIPKTVKQHRLKENISALDFKLTPVEMAQLDLLDQNKRTLDICFVEGDMDPRKLPTYPEDELKNV